MLNASLLKQYRPKGVMKVVKCIDVAAKGICQKPLFAFSLLNTATPANWASVSSTTGKGCIHQTFPKTTKKQWKFLLND